MVAHNKFNKKIILSMEQLHSFEASEEAAKLFTKYALEHPEKSLDNLHMQITQSEEVDTPYNTGGTVSTLVIYEYIAESDVDYEARINAEEQSEINELLKEFQDSIAKFYTAVNYKLTDANKSYLLKELDNILNMTEILK